jgi:hypothetical protein
VRWRCTPKLAASRGRTVPKNGASAESTYRIGQRDRDRLRGAHMNGSRQGEIKMLSLRCEIRSLFTVQRAFLGIGAWRDKVQ